MAWFKKDKVDASPVRIPREHQHPGDWITVPFRFAEAARLSIHTIGCQEDIPAPVRFWIAQWLADYNWQLVSYMKEYYGSEILPLLDKITDSVKPSATVEEPEESTWDHWENQFREDG
jgi:hypothetical protein